jgi:hypothetical protein
MTKRSTKKALEWTYARDTELSWQDIENALAEEREDDEDTETIGDD